MLGSSQSVSGPNIALNTIMAEELRQFADELEQNIDDFQNALNALIKRVFTEHQRIIFNGNGYDDAWIQEAERRGLSNFASAADALPMYTAGKNIDLFVRHGIYTREEINARAEIHIENYTAVLLIEANTMIDMIRHEILPAVSGFAEKLCVRSGYKQKAGFSHEYESETAREISGLTDALFQACKILEQDLENLPDDPTRAMVYCHENLLPHMKEARTYADRLELLTDQQDWPFPVYSELLFSV